MVKKKNNKKGFTLAELLIVVAIIAVLVAISVPIFNSQLKKARLATNQANARSAHAALVAQLLTDGDESGTATYSDGKLSDVSTATAQSITDDPSKWTTDGNGGTKMSDKVYDSWTVTVASDGTVTYAHSN